MAVTVNRLNRAVTPGSFDRFITARRLQEKPFIYLANNRLDGSCILFGRGDVGYWDDALSDADGYLPSPVIITVDQEAAAYGLQINGLRGVFPVNFTVQLYHAGSLLTSRTVTDNTDYYCTVAFGNAYNIDKFVVQITRISAPYEVLRLSTLSFSAAISSLCSERSRKLHAKLEVIYNNPLLDTSGEAASEYSAHSAKPSDLLDGMQSSNVRLFRLYDNKLDGSYAIAGTATQVGWWSKGLPDADGVYAEPKRCNITFSARPLFTHTVYGYAPTNDYPVDFNLYVTDTAGVEHLIEVRDNHLLECPVVINVDNAVKLSIEILRSSNPYRPAIITELSVASSITYYDKDLIDVEVTEELTYEDSNQVLGGVSANELVANFNNTNGAFYFDNLNSMVASRLKKNRRIKAWFGIEAPSGDILWSDMGTFWSYAWDVPVGSLTARVTAFDTIGLLNTMTFFNHNVFVDASIGEVLEYIFSDAKAYFSELSWRIDASLYNIHIPYIWFNYGSYAAALERLAQCDLIYIYCDREGRVVASVKPDAHAIPSATWSDDTNIKTTTYPTMYTDLANQVEVAITTVTQESGELLNYTVPTRMRAGEFKHIQFNYPMLSVDTVNIEASASVEYELYAWGMSIRANVDCTISTVQVTGTYLSIDSSQSIARKDEESIRANGTVVSNVSSDLIQTAEHANRIVDYLFAGTALTKYDAEVTYRGDISLTIGDPIELLNGRAPINSYFIKRHELYFNGALTGTARLST